MGNNSSSEIRDLYSSVSLRRTASRNVRRLAGLILCWGLLFNSVSSLDAAPEPQTYHAFGNPNLDEEGRCAVWKYQADVVSKVRHYEYNPYKIWDDYAELEEIIWDRIDDLEWYGKRIKDVEIKKAVAAFVAEYVRTGSVKRALLATSALGAVEIVEKVGYAYRAWLAIEELTQLERESDLLMDAKSIFDGDSWEVILKRRGLI